ncbi:MAG: DUF2087 domain-containing protein [Treponema sp.]|nr:DUF2087 domain-containing protein [Treponema sp.]
MNEITDTIEASLEEIGDLARGYRKDGHGRILRCLHCAQAFDTELLHAVTEGMGTAERAAREHVERVHGGPLEALLAFGKERTGLSDIQETLLRSFHAGADDRETALRLGGKSESTVRNHRFQLRRREGEARIFVALMALVAARESPQSKPFAYPLDLPADGAIYVTEPEAESIEAHYLDFSKAPAMPKFPKRQKEKLVLLKRIAERFELDRTYTETEVNRILMPIHADYVMIRRYLIDFRFLEREADGSAYRRRNP